MDPPIVSPSINHEGPIVFDKWKNFFLAAGFGEAAATHYETIFKSNEIELNMIPDLTHEVLLQMGFTKAGHRIKIMRLRSIVISQNTGEIIRDHQDVHHDISSFIYQGKLYHKHIPIHAENTKSHLIPVNLGIDKKKVQSGHPSPSEDLNAKHAVSTHPVSTIRQASSPSSPEVNKRYNHANSMNKDESSDLISKRTQSTNSIPRGSSIGEIFSSAPILDDSESQDTSHPSDEQQDNKPLRHLENLESSSVSSSMPMSIPQVVQRASVFSGSPQSPSFMHNYSTFISGSPTTSDNVSVVKYYLNNDIAKHRVKLSELTVRAFSQQVRQQDKLSQDFAVFMFDVPQNRLKVLKDTSEIDPSHVYYVLENSRIDGLYKKVEKKIKKDQAPTGHQVWNSDNNPLQVDFIPDEELYMTQMGRIGLCMCPGRKKKSAEREWDRDLQTDLTRIRDLYKCDVLVSLVRRSELVELQIPNLLDEVENHGMESIHFPITDKWIPQSMPDLIRLVDTLIQRLKDGKTLVIHCNGGKGRSGTVAVACLVAMGKRVQKSIEAVRKSRSGTIRNPVQIVYVKRFKSAFKQYLKKKSNNIDDTTSAMDWDSLESAALDESSSEDDLEMAAKAGRKDEDKSRKEREKAAEKQRKEEEKMAEKQRKEEEKAEKAIEKALERAKKEEEKAKKEEDKALEKAKKEESKQISSSSEKIKKEDDKRKRRDSQTPSPQVQQFKDRKGPETTEKTIPKSIKTESGDLAGSVEEKPKEADKKPASTKITIVESSSSKPNKKVEASPDL